jgi:hypothetical protein
MAKDEGSNQLNLTVVALVALVAIVGLVALVMNAASVKQLATGSKVVSAADTTTQNIAGDMKKIGAESCSPPCSGGQVCCKGSCQTMDPDTGGC